MRKEKFIKNFHKKKIAIVTKFVISEFQPIMNF